MDSSDVIKDGGKRNKSSAININKKIKTLILLLLLLALSFVALQFATAITYSAKISVGNVAQERVNPNAQLLDFGTIPEGGSSMRFVAIENDGRHDVYIMAIKLGSIAKFINVEQNDFILHPGEAKQIDIVAEIPAESSQKDYSGVVIIFRFPQPF